MLQDQDEGRTPLQKRMSSFGKKLAYAVLAICAIVFVTGLFRGEPPLLMLLTAMALSNDARKEASGAVIGDPTEAALFNLALEKGFLRDKLDETFPRLAELPFDSDRKLMTTFHPWDKGRVVSFTKGAGEAVAMCRSAGIRPVMITGDHPLTAEVIAKRVGIIRGEGKAVMTGRELAQIPLEEFENKVEKIRVYARVAPEQKLKIIKALQDKGHFVAMTGDGVNDVPALKRADIGVAMGITGTDVSKEASHMILLDDNFATIVKAVREGRRIFDNIRKFIKYTMTSNSGEICTIFFAPFLGLPIPLLPIHILWINLVTDGVPGLALAAEPGERNIMSRPPREPKESIFAKGLGIHIIWVGLLMGAVSIITQAWFIEGSQTHWQTMVFTVLCLSQMGHVLAVRSEQESFFTQGALSNKPLLGAVLLTFALQMATIYVPFLNPIFKTEPLTAGELVVTILLSTVVFLAVELEKAIKRSRISDLLF